MRELIKMFFLDSLEKRSKNSQICILVFLINPVNIKCYMRNELGGDNYSVWYKFDVTYAFM